MVNNNAESIIRSPKTQERKHAPVHRFRSSKQACVSATLGETNHTKAKIPVPVRRTDAAPKGRPAVLSVKAPTAAAKHTERTRGQPCRVGCAARRIITVPIPAPLMSPPSPPAYAHFARRRRRLYRSCASSAGAGLRCSSWDMLILCSNLLFTNLRPRFHTNILPSRRSPSRTRGGGQRGSL
jgi:hypothetical protein